VEPSQIRREILQLKEKREELEKVLMKRRSMVDACLIKRYLGTKHQKRGKPYYYLSWKESGQKTKLEYIRLANLYRTKKRTYQWREFSHAMTEWVKISEDIERNFRSLGEAQIEE